MSEREQRLTKQGYGDLTQAYRPARPLSTMVTLREAS